MMLRRLPHIIFIVALATATGACARTLQSESTRVNPDARLLMDFNERVKTYMQARNSVKGEAPAQTVTTEPGKIQHAERTLADRIRAARPNAKHGDIFTPAISAKFRALLNPELKGRDGANTRQQIQEDNPGPIPLRVNETYPEAAPVSTVPPNILTALPQLPKDLEYRFTGKHMVLYDPGANLVVDYIPNAIS